MSTAEQHTVRDALLTQYETEIATAFSDQLNAFTDLIKNGAGNLKSIAGRCGAHCAAAHKRCKRDLVMRALKTERDAGLDITPSVVAHVFERLIGRGVDERAAASLFATPGRTAANKSTVGASDLVDLEQRLSTQIHELMEGMLQIREQYREDYDEKAKKAAESLSK